jgi:UDP-N-acetylmuramate dehydrogenase
MSCLPGCEAICQADAPLSEHTWYKLGGPARWLLTPRDETELAAALACCRSAGVSWRLLGRGANVLVRDAGFDGAVIKLVGPAWEAVRWEESMVQAAAGADFQRLVRASVERGLGGLETLAGIPGSVGGIVRMNAGGKHGYISQYTRQARVMDGAGRIESWDARRIGFGYRHTEIDNVILLSAAFVLERGDREALWARFLDIWKEKSAEQPALGGRTAGCIFKNPLIAGQRLPAGRLIDQAGLKGLRVGGAEISRKHANFIEAGPGAKAQDVIDLIELARQAVRQNAEIELEPEIEIW